MHPICINNASESKMHNNTNPNQRQMKQEPQKTHNQTYSQRSNSYIPPKYTQLLPDTQIRKETDRFINHYFASQSQQQSNTPNQIPNVSIGPFTITYNSNTTNNNPKLTQPEPPLDYKSITI